MSARTPFCIVFALIALLPACASSNARIISRSQGTIVAEIVGRKGDNLVVIPDINDANEPSSNQKEIPVSDILNIQHPGESEKVAGTILTCAGVVLVGLGLAVVLSGDDGLNGLGEAVVGGTIMLIGVPVAVVGGSMWLFNGIVYHTSESAAEGVGQVTMQLTPMITTQTAGFGLSLWWP